jgi:LacI family transcriptional regulator
MERKRVTIADVARHAGLSRTAVSLILNNRVGTRLSPDAVERVRRATEELGYRPNLTARALASRRSHAIGFVSDRTATERYASALIHGALVEARSRGYVLFIAETEGQPDAEREAFDALIDRQVDGLIFATSWSRKLELPAPPPHTRLVLLNAVSDDVPTAILPDELRAGREIVDLLLNSGHRDGVVVIGRSPAQPADEWYTPTVQRRVEGIWASLLEHGVNPVAEVPCQRWYADEGYAAMRNLLVSGLRPQAVICLNDRLAFGVYRALTEFGIKIPDDTSLVSFDDDEIAQYLHPQLTTAALPYEEMGTLAVQLLLDPAAEEREYLVEMPIRIRESIRP